jgi:hypothetical protein
MKRSVRTGSLNKKANVQHPGQSLVEFALILPLFVLIIVGVFDIGRAFFAYIAISNAAREGARIYTFWPDKTTLANMEAAIDSEIGTNSIVDTDNIEDIKIQCGDPLTDLPAGTLDYCPSEEPIQVTITYTHEIILSFFFSEPITLVRSAEMMVP